MKLIVGLGNPGIKYINNRHNAGFMFLDYLLKTINESANSWISEFKYNKYLQSEIALFNDSRFALHDLLIVKPQTFMNCSGFAVSQLVSRYALCVSRDLIIVHDDLDIPLGKFKVQTGTGPQLHNGIASINASLKTHDYLRVRIGVDNRPLANRNNGESYVLQDFTKEELTTIHKQLFPTIYSQLLISKLI